MAQIGVFLGKNYLVTVNQSDVKPLSALFQTCRDNAARRQDIMGRGPAYILYTILDRLVDDLFPMLDNLMQELEAIEDSHPNALGLPTTRLDIT
ncbi:MAG: CorA family divalent cation transporter [Nitrososphaerota archaeon]